MRQTFRGIVAVLLVAMFAAVGVGIGSNLVTHFRNLFLYNEVLTIVQHRYVDKIEPSELIMNSVAGMLRTLDPHSQLMDASMSKRFREEQKGSFYGIGVQFDIINGVLTVISPIEGTPAYKVGLLAGDRIVEIEGEDARGITTMEVLQKLKGPKGTEVRITVEREGVDSLLTFTIVRDKIPTLSVPYYFMIDEKVGYLRLVRFAETTADEMREAISKLKQMGMEELILDLRMNAGGLLNQAIYVSDMFLDAGMPIVSTKGRTRNSNQEFYASAKTVSPHMPLVVLIDDGTASGAEIVSGAIQDMDRGIIIGERSFGKALVQTPFQLPENWTLVLTTARYYTPSGRCIQKPYSDYSDYLGEERKDQTQQEQGVYKTRAGRPVQGGGGIHPDVVVESTKLGKTVEKLYRKNIFTLFGLHYAALHRDLPRDFKITDEIVKEFMEFAAENGAADMTEEELLQEQQSDYIKTYIKWRIVRSLWGNEEAAKTFSKVDDQVQKALELMPEARKLLEETYMPFAREQNPDVEPAQSKDAASKTESWDLAA